MTNTGKYYKELLLKKGIPQKNIIYRSKVSSKTLDNFLNDRIDISRKNFEMIEEAIRSEIKAVERDDMIKEKDRIFDEVEKIYKLLPEDMQLEILDHVRGLERIELGRSHRR